MNLYSKFQLFSNEAVDETEKRMVKTALLRYLVPAFSGPCPSGPRMLMIEELKAIAFLQNINIDTPRDAFNRLEAFFKREQFAAKLCNKQRYYLKKFFDFAQEKSLLQSIDSTKKATVVLRAPNGTRRCDIPSFGLTHREKYILNKEARAKIKDKLEETGETAKATAVDRLDKSIDDFYGWMLSSGKFKEGASTPRTRLENVERCLGWLHKYEGIPIEDLSLNSIIQFAKRPKRTQFPPTVVGQQEWEAADYYAKATAKEMAINDIKMIKKYLNFYSENIRTRSIVTDSVKTLAGYIYDSEITFYDSSGDIDEEYIPSIIKHLRKLQSSETADKNCPPAVDEDLKFVEYPEALRVVLELKKEADTTIGQNSRRRAIKGVARSYQHFLVIAFLCLFPPERQQIIRCLKLGASFAKGCVVRGPKFIPAEQMKDPSQAKWCFNIPKEEQKMGYIYGDYVIPLFNFVFEDGSTLHEYIDRWVEYYRLAFDPKEDYLFIGTKKGTQLSSTRIWEMVRRKFFLYLGKPTNPHLLRKIYKTFLKESKVPGYIEDLASKAMKHSREIADKVYNLALLEEELRPIFEFNQQVINAMVKDEENYENSG